MLASFTGGSTSQGRQLLETPLHFGDDQLHGVKERHLAALPLAGGSTQTLSTQNNGDAALPVLRYTQAATSGEASGGAARQGLSSAVRSFVLWPPALFVGIAVFSAVPLLLLLLPYAWRTMSKLTAIDAFAMARPLEPGEELRRFPSPMGAAITTTYYSGTLGAALIMLLAWIADNAVYSSSLRPLPGGGGFSWSSVPSPLQAAVLFGADASASCGGVTWAASPPPQTTADVVPISVPASMAAPGSSQLPTLCLVRIAVQGFAADASSPLLLNASLLLPSSAQSVAWSVSGIMTPAGKEVGANYSAWATGSISALPTSIRGMASILLDVGAMPIVETDEVVGRSATGLMLTSAAAVAVERTAASFVPGAETLPFTLTVRPGTQLFAISVIPRVSFTQLLGGMAGLLGGLGAAYKIAFSISWKVRFKLWGAPYWETEALRKRGASSAPRQPSHDSDFATSLSDVDRKGTSAALPASLRHARGSLFGKPGGFLKASRRGAPPPDSSDTAGGSSAASGSSAAGGAGVVRPSRRSLVRSIVPDAEAASAGAKARETNQPSARAADSAGELAGLQLPHTASSSRNPLAAAGSSNSMLPNRGAAVSRPSRRSVLLDDSVTGGSASTLPAARTVAVGLGVVDKPSQEQLAPLSEASVATALSAPTADAQRDAAAEKLGTSGLAAQRATPATGAQAAAAEADGVAATSGGGDAPKKPWLRPTASRRRTGFGPSAATDDEAASAGPSLAIAVRAAAVAASLAASRGRSLPMPSDAPSDADDAEAPSDLDGCKRASEHDATSDGETD